jgi:heme/copper-type cytochrome/quinol oxidase subunit 3
VLRIIRANSRYDEEQAERVLESAPFPFMTEAPKATADKVVSQLEQAGAKAKTEPLVFHQWPKPYDHETNPLSINLTALNTFILICSSVTMVLALGAIQRGDRFWCSLYLLATVLIGSTFLSIQVFEYSELMFGRFYPIGISTTSHFRPSVSLFASCFFTMTGFHGAHVTGGVILLTCILIQSLLGTYTKEHHSPVELAGLYWHFVDLVWIILFTVVYLI